jgi:hypothetical protein
MISKETFTHDRAFLLSEIDISNVVSNDEDLKCEVFINPGKYLENSASTSFAFQKDFPLKEIIDYQLRRFVQSGLLDQLQKKYFHHPMFKDCEPPLREIDLRVSFLAFALLSLGAFVALIIFVTEKISFRVNSQKIVCLK